MFPKLHTQSFSQLFSLSFALALVCSVDRVWAQGPAVGDIERLPVITLDLHVGSSEKDMKRATYTPPPGWHIRSHTVALTQRYGHSSFAISTVPADWLWLSDERFIESYQQQIELAIKAHNVPLENRLKFERNEMLREMQMLRSSHHALVVEASARGEGFFRGGSGLQMTVTAELVYVGTTDSPPTSK